MTSRFERAIALIDEANAADPNRIEVAGASRAAEVVYAERMSETLARLHPAASEALRLAARAQHVQRWTVPRASFPMDRSGYHRWRNTLKARHAELAGQLLASAGYERATIDRVGALIRKADLKGDAETQALEDTVCIVFLSHYADAFFGKHDDAKVVDILRKTWSKMSGAGQRAAAELTLSPRLARLMREALASPGG